jgi:hypothetical protein
MNFYFIQLLLLQSIPPLPFGLQFGFDLSLLLVDPPTLLLFDPPTLLLFDPPPLLLLLQFKPSLPFGVQFDLFLSLLLVDPPPLLLLLLLSLDHHQALAKAKCKKTIQRVLMK